MASYPCPQCGEKTAEEDFSFGVCTECAEANHTELMRHNAEYDRWQKMTDCERENAIRWATNNFD